MEDTVLRMVQSLHSPMTGSGKTEHLTSNETPVLSFYGLVLNGIVW